MNPPTSLDAKIQFSISVDDNIALSRFMFERQRRKGDSPLVLYLYYWFFSLGIFYLAITILGRSNTPFWLTLIVTGIYGFGIWLYLDRRARRRLDLMLRETRLLARHERGDFQHQTLQITNRGLIEETPIGRFLIFWEDGIQIDELDRDRTAILIANGWRGAIVLPAKGVEVGDYQQFLTDLRQMVEISRQPIKLESINAKN